MTQKRLRWPRLIVLLGIIIVSVGVLLLIGIRNIPSISEQIPSNSTVFQVNILHPRNQSGWPMNYHIPVTVSAWGAEPVKKIELYINSQLYAVKEINYNQTYENVTAQWRWQPGEEGIYILTARALGASGAAGISEPIIIKTGAEFITRSPLDIQEETTLQLISAEQNISLEDLQQANTALQPDETINPGDSVFLPNAPISIDNPIIAALDPNGQEISYPEPGQPEQEAGQTPSRWNFIQDLLFLIKSKNTPEAQLYPENPEENPGESSATGGESTGPTEESTTPSDPSKLPPAIDLFGSFDGCDVNLHFSAIDRPDRDGFFIYRSRDGAQFERIATILPSNSQDYLKYYEFKDQDQYGLVTYYAAGFNIYGENPGPTISFPLDAMNCSNNDGQLTTTWIDGDGNLKLFAGMDTAYLYLQIDNGIAERVPEGNRMFLPKSGESFNLTNYLDNREDLLDMTDFSIHLEVWAWNGGDLLFMGTIDQQIHRSILQVCDTEGEGACTASGGGSWTNEMTIFPNIYMPLNEQKYELRWLSSNLSETSKICLGVGESFFGPGLTDSNPTLLKACYYSTLPGGPVEGNQGTYLLDFGRVLYPDGNPLYPPYNGKNENYQYPDFDASHPMGDPFSLAVRFLPVMKDNSFNDMSNTVYMHHLSYFEESGLPPLASQLPSLYDIEILEDTYLPPEYEIASKWACVIIDSDPTGQYSEWVGQEVCPFTYVECGKNITCEDTGFFGMLSAAWDMIVNAYEDVKNYLSGTIIEIIPYCEGSDACESAVQAGVDYAVTAATGIPPDLPNSDELIAAGAEELITYGLNEAGGEIVGEVAGEELGKEYGEKAGDLICNDDCKAAIREEVLSYVQLTQAYNNQEGCKMENPHYGYFPICFLPPVEVHPVLGSSDFPGAIVIRVTRKNTPESLLVTSDRRKELAGKFQLRVTVAGTNSSRIGYYGNFCTYYDNIPQDQLPDPANPNSNANHGYTYLGDFPMEGPLFYPVMVEIPWLEPGESIDIPISLKAQWTTERKPNCVNSMSQYLFYRGTSFMEVKEYCLSEDSSQLWVPCTSGGKDSWEYTNPDAPGN